MKIKTYGEKILRVKCDPVKKQELSTLQETINQMITTMRKDQGAGLAAPQVGLDKQIIVVEVEDNLYILINPKITKKSFKKDKMEEGCLSLPGIAVEVKRPVNIKVEFLDREGKLQKASASGLLARVIQHETDHLKGKLIIDYLGYLERKEIVGLLEDARCAKGPAHLDKIKKKQSSKK